MLRSLVARTHLRHTATTPRCLQQCRHPAMPLSSLATRKRQDFVSPSLALPWTAAHPVLLPTPLRTTTSKEIANAHLAQEALEDPDTPPGEPVRLTTRDTVEGRVIVEELGIVAGSSARSRNILIDILTRLKGFFGGSLTPYSEMYSEATTEATEMAMKEAEKLGATSIIRVRYQNACTETKLTGVSVYVLCYGTAVKCVVKGKSLGAPSAFASPAALAASPLLKVDEGTVQPVFVAPASVQAELLQSPSLLKQHIDIQWQQLQQLLHLQKMQSTLIQQQQQQQQQQQEQTASAEKVVVVQQERARG